MLNPIEGKEDLFKWTGDFPKTKEFVIENMKQERFATSTEDAIQKLAAVPKLTLPPAFAEVNNSVVRVRDYTTEDATRNSYRELCAALSYLGIKNFSLTKGTFKDKHDRDVKLTKLFDPGSLARQDLEKAQSAGLYVLLTNSPPMRYTMSTGRGWTSCMRMNYSSDRFNAVMQKEDYLVAYIIHDQAPEFDELASVHGRFIVGLGGARNEVLAGHMLSHADTLQNDQHKLDQVLAALKQLNLYDETNLYLSCPVCGQRLTKRAKVNKDKFNEWLEGTLYTSKNALHNYFNNIIDCMNTKLEEGYGVKRLDGSYIQHYIHGDGLPYREGQLNGNYIQPQVY